MSKAAFEDGLAGWPGFSLPAHFILILNRLPPPAANVTLVPVLSGLPTRLVQLIHPDEGRRVALVDDNELHLLATHRSVYSFAQAALDTGWRLRDLLSTDLSGLTLDYDQVHRLATPWLFFPCFDHPEEPGRCLVSSAGPPWQYIASGASLRGHGDSLPLAGFADVAAVYLMARDGLPRRVGVTLGQRGRISSIGPELILDPALPRFKGAATLQRDHGSQSKELLAEVPVQLALASVEPDHFEAADFRRPGDTHIHFFGERIFGPVLAAEGADLDGADIQVEFEGLGRALLNTVHYEAPAARRVAAVQL